MPRPAAQGPRLLAAGGAGQRLRFPQERPAALWLVHKIPSGILFLPGSCGIQGQQHVVLQAIHDSEKGIFLFKP